MRSDSPAAAARRAPQQEDDALSVAASGSLAPSIRPAWEEDDGVMQATLASMLANRPILEKYNEHLSGSLQQEDDALSVAASGSLAPSIRPAWEEDDGVMLATLASILANRPILEKYNEYLSGSPQQEDDALSVAASGSLAPSIRPAWEEDDGVMLATFAIMMANRPVVEKYNEYLSGPAKVVDITHTHMTVVKMFNRAAAPSGIIKPVQPRVLRTMRHSATDQYTLAPPAKQINQRDRNKRLRMKQQIPPADKFKQGDFNGQRVTTPVDSVYEIAREKCELWMATWIGDCGHTVQNRCQRKCLTCPQRRRTWLVPSTARSIRQALVSFERIIQPRPRVNFSARPRGQW
jgi:hypothetical protein